jgi:hypothetical protein
LVVPDPKGTASTTIGRDAFAAGRTGDWSRRVAHRVGADVITVDGGHYPFFAGPDTLVAALETLVLARPTN